jgi:hypothetical protein
MVLKGNDVMKYVLRTKGQNTLKAPLFARICLVVSFTGAAARDLIFVCLKNESSSSISRICRPLP